MLRTDPEIYEGLLTKDGGLRTRSGEKYIALFKEGRKSNRVGRIIAIDFEKDAAKAKAEILFPNRRIYTDYFLPLKYEGSCYFLPLKYEGSWKIVPSKH